MVFATPPSSPKKLTQQQPSNDFSTLDPTDAVQSRRIQQRRRTILRGKNTVGYTEYLKAVPKHKRRPRNMKYPVTPNHTVDIPNKRWLGLVKAW